MSAMKKLICVATGFICTLTIAFAQNETMTTATVVENPATVVTSPTTTATVVTSPTTTATVVERPMIITTVPAPKEVIETPTGFVNCFTVKEGWYQDIWVAAHRVCQYENSPSGTVWIEGYWACTQYNIDEKKCTTWEWKTAHWEKTLIVY